MKLLYVYIVLCSDSSYYTGVSNNPERRESEHNAGEDIKAYTYTRRPVKLVFVSDYLNPFQAIEFEKQVKGWSRKKKQALINNRWDLLPKLAACKNKTHYRNRLCFDSAQHDGKQQSSQS